MSSFRCVLTA